MFALTPDELGGKVLDYAAGPSSFNAEATSGGRKVVSCDPLYHFTPEEIRSRIEATHATVVANAVEIRGVPYEFQRGGDEMLAVAR